jgi:ketosteroid isomerase-like protein
MVATVLSMGVTVGPAAAQKDTGAQQPSAIRAAIEEGSRNTMALFARQDAAGLAATYTKDAKVMPANSDFIAGEPSIRAFWQAVFDVGARGFLLETLEVEGLGDTAYEVGKYALRDKDQKVMDQGKYLLIWKLEDGQWKIHRDIWTTSLPAAQP